MKTSSERVGIEWLSEIGLPPTELVSLAADAGCRFVSTNLARLAYNPLGYPAWSLLDSALLRREMKARMVDRGVSISLAEGCHIGPDHDVRAHERALEVFHELGATRLNTVSFDPDSARTFDQFCKLAELAGDGGFELTIEFIPILTIRTLDDAVELVQKSGYSHAKILLDIMHFVRAGHQPVDLRRIDPALFGYVQVCDGPLSGGGDYLDEAMNDRAIPGDGQMPLREILAALPNGIMVSAEVPQSRKSIMGTPPLERFRKMAAATRRLLERKGTAR